MNLLHTCRAGDGNWTHDLFLTKEALYLWATLAYLRAEDEVRTRDPQLGRLMLYRLSYFRKIKNRGESRIRTYEGVRQQIYSLPQLATLVSPHNYNRSKNLEPMEGFEPPTSWLQISCSGQLSYIGINCSFPFEFRDCKDIGFWLNSKKKYKFLSPVLQKIFRLKASAQSCKRKRLLSRQLQLCWKLR